MKSFDIFIEQGNSLNLSLVASDISGNLLNLSGYNATGQVQYGYGSTGILLNLSPQIDPSFISGLINVNISGQETTGLPVTKAVYEISVYNNSGCTFKVLGGYCNIGPGICF